MPRNLIQKRYLPLAQDRDPKAGVYGVVASEVTIDKLTTDLMVAGLENGFEVAHFEGGWVSSWVLWIQSILRECFAHERVCWGLESECRDL